MTCTHGNPDDRWYRGNLCFACHQAEREIQRAEHRQTLARQLASGQTIREGWPAGRSILWRIREGRAETLHVWNNGQNGRMAEWHFPRVDRPEINTPDAIAEHLENRAFGFGWSLGVQS